jgi:protein TonB
MDRGEPARRRLRHALVASLLIHLVLFWPVTLPVLVKDTPSPLQATLRRLAPAELPPVGRPRLAPPAPMPPDAPAPPPESNKPPSLAKVPVLPADPVAMPASRPDPVPPAAAPASAPAVAVGPVSGSLLTQATASRDAADGLRAYRLDVAAHARPFKRYPGQALASGWAGSADIRLEVGGDGRPRTASVVRSSGHEPLDRAALTMIEAGAARARLPESLRGKSFAVVLPVVFNQDDE